MSFKKVEEVKRDKGFRIYDLIIYGVILLAVAVAFAAVFLSRDKGGIKGFSVYSGGDLIYSYSFSDGETVCGEGVESSTDGDILKLEISTAGGGVNTVEADLKNKTVRVTEANCSNRKDCVHTPAIRDNSGVIYCMPHSLKITPLNPVDGGSFRQ